MNQLLSNRYKNRQKEFIRLTSTFYIDCPHYKQVTALERMKDQKDMANNYPLNVDSQSDQYEVEQILDKRPYGNGFMYLIKWQNYPDPKDYTWEPVSHLTRIKGMLKKFNAQYEKQSKDSQKKPNETSKRQREHSLSPERPESQKSSLKEIAKKKFQTKKIQKQRKELKYKSKEGNVSSSKINQRNSNKFQKEMAQQVNLPQSKPVNSQGDNFWQVQGRSLGRIHKHFYSKGDLIFDVNVNNRQELICGTAYLTLGELAIDHEQKLIEYMQNWSKSELIEEYQRNTQSYKQFMKFWGEIQ